MSGESGWGVIWSRLCISHIVRRRFTVWASQVRRFCFSVRVGDACHPIGVFLAPLKIAGRSAIGERWNGCEGRPGKMVSTEATFSLSVELGCVENVDLFRRG